MGKLTKTKKEAFSEETFTYINRMFSGGLNMSNILIVGANRGIGYYMANSFTGKGNNVTVLDIQDDHIR